MYIQGIQDQNNQNQLFFSNRQVVVTLSSHI